MHESSVTDKPISVEKSSPTNHMPSLDDLARSTNLDSEALKLLDIEWRTDVKAFAIPERDGDGNVIGYATRTLDGDKRFISGGKRGLTYVTPFLDEDDVPILLVEGMTDVAAGLLLGFVTVGRPSNTGGIKHAVQLLRGRSVVVVGERDGDFDADTSLPNKSPGKLGAKQHAETLVNICPSVKVIYPPKGIKDLRAWFHAGVTHNEIIQITHDTLDLVDLVTRPTETQTRSTPKTWQPFPVDLLPDVMAQFVAETASAVGCDAAYIATPLITGLASAVGMTRRLRLKHSWTEPCVIWSAVVGDSGTMKSPGMDAALKPLRDIQRRAFKEHQQAEAAYESALIDYEAARKRYKPSDGEPPAKPTPPRCRRLWTDDATVESLATMLQDNPRGILCAKDELAGWLGGFDRYAKATGGDVPRWLSMHGGRDLIVDRRTSGTVCVAHAAVGVTGGIQPGILTQCLTDAHAESGLKARLLLVNPPRKAKRWTETDVSESTVTLLGNVYAQLLHMDFGTDDHGDPVPIDVTLSPEAKRLWVAFYNEHAKETAGESGELAAAFSKLEGYAARFALILHLARWAGCEKVDPEAVDAKSMGNAIALIHWWCHETRRVYAMLSGTGKERQDLQLVEWIQAKGGSVTSRDLQQQHRKQYPKADDAKQALAKLATAGWGTYGPTRPGPKGGRPGERFTLHERTTTELKTLSQDVDSEGFGFCEFVSDGYQPPLNGSNGVGSVA